MSVSKLHRQCGTNAWAYNNCPVVLMIETHCNHLGFSTIYICNAFDNFCFFLLTKMGLKFHHKQADSEVILWLYIKRINLNIGNPKSKVSEWKQQFVTSFVIKHTWQTPVDNCDKGVRKQDRDCARFAFYQCSANNKSSKYD